MSSPKLADGFGPKPGVVARLRSASTVALTLVGGAFVVAIALHDRRELTEWVATFDPIYASGAMCSLMLSTIGAGLVFGAIARQEVGEEVSSPQLLPIFLLSQVAKYIPGRIWTVVLQQFASSGRVPGMRLVVANIEIALMALVTTLGATAVFWGGAAGGWFWVLPGMAAVWLAVRVLLAVRLSRMFHGALRRLVPSLTGPSPVHGKRQSSLLTAGSLLFVSGYCVGWVLLMCAGGMTLHGALQVGAMLSLAYVVGMLSLLPAGLGAREAALLALGGFMAADASSASVAVVSRLAMIAVDTIAALFAAALLWWRRHQ